MAPENTLAAFAAGLAAGADRLELDVHATADGEVVVIHDAMLERTTDGTGRCAALPLAALERLDAGYRFRAPDGTYPFRGRGLRVPTLAELLEAYPGRAAQHRDEAGRARRSRQRCSPCSTAPGARQRTLLAAEHAAIMDRIRAAAPDVLTSFSAAEVGGLRLPAA